MSIAIQSNVPLVAIQGVTADVVLQPGTVISAQVQQVLANDQVQILIGGQSLQVTSQVPLQAGQSLQLAVSQGADGTVQLAVVNPPSSNTSGVTSSSTAGASASVNPGLANLGSAIAASDTALLATAIAPTGNISATSNQLTPLQSLAVSAAAQTAATQQASLAPLFANLEAATGLSGLPPQVQQVAALVLAQRVGLDQGLTGNDIQQAFQSSGLFLEASLASGSFASSSAAPDLKASLIVLRQVLTTALGELTPTPTIAAPTIAPQVPTSATSAQPGTAPEIIVVEPGGETLQVPLELSSALTITAGAETQTTASPALAPLLAAEIVAGEGASQAGATAIPQAVLEFAAANAALSSAATPADAAARTAATSAALNLLQEAVQASPQASPLTASSLSGLLANDSQMLSLLPAVAGARLPDNAPLARTSVPPPPVGGALPAAQPVMPATLSGNSSPEAAMHHLLTDTDSAIARQTLLQVASLPDQVDSTVGRIDPTAPRWNFEIPFVTAQGTAMAQFEISRDGGTVESDAKRIWRAKFSLDVEPAGPVHAQISLSGERTSVRMWAERPATADQLRAGVTQLSQALSRAELVPGDIVIRDGAPVQSATARAGHFLDRAL